MKLQNTLIGWMGARHAGVSVVLTLLLILLLHQNGRTGLTVDEPSHFAAGYSYWLGDDSLQPADTPPFTRLISGWVARLLALPTPESTRGWTDKDAYVIGFELLGAKDGRRALLLTRLPFLLFPLGIVWLVWSWSLELYGAKAAFVVAAFCALEPTILGHGVLIKSDVPAAFFALWFGYRAWRFLSTPTIFNFALVATAAALGVLTKFTLLLLLPLSVFLALAKGRRLPNLLMVFVIPYLGILLSAGAKPAPLSGLLLHHVQSMPLHDRFPSIFDFLARLPWPSQYINGLLYISGALRGNGFAGYLNGSKIDGWVPEYFPLAMLYKEPVPLLALATAGMIFILGRALRHRQASGEQLPVVLALTFFAAGVFSNFHIGVRHILPAIPFLLIASGAAIEWLLARRPGQIVLVAAGAWFLFGFAKVHPHSLSYCNEIAGGPAGCWRHLADSNVDWGQNYPDLGRALKRIDAEPVKCFLFSFDNPWHHMPEGKLQPMPLPAESDAPTRFRPSSGYYAVSVNYLTGLLLPKGHEDYLATFRSMPVYARAGYSIFIYKVD